MGKVKIEWSPNFSYAIGLLTTDGNLSKDGRHMEITSKDLEIVENFKKCLKIHNKIAKKQRGGEKEKRYFRVQFGDTIFYKFLLDIGLAPAKSKILKKINIPNEYFADFLRGCIDGDGSIGSFKHPESSHPQIRLKLSSASLIFLIWIKNITDEILKIKGGWIHQVDGVGNLVYGTKDSLKILNFIYYPKVEFFLNRKYKKAKMFL